jgi:KUP system potassium uptake protein
MTPEHERAGHAHSTGLAALALGALGVVYGDIGTSPLYAMREAFTGPHGLPATPENVYGVLSLVFWALNFVVSFKYIGHVMKADNRGEGGILALLALVRSRGKGGRGQALLIGLGLFGAALLYGDGVITPAISVLGAVEGIEVATPAFSRFAHRGDHPGGALLVPAPWHRPDRARLWPDHAGLVLLHCGARRARHSPPP